MINNPMGINADRVTTEDNKVADRIARIHTEDNLSSDMLPIVQGFPLLLSCTRFHQSAEIIFLVLETLLQKKSIDPLLLNRKIRENLGKTITSSFAMK